MQPDPTPLDPAGSVAQRGAESPPTDPGPLSYRSSFRDPLHFVMFVIGTGLLVAFMLWMAVLQPDVLNITGAIAVTALYGLSASVARRCDVFEATYTPGRLAWSTAHASGVWSTETTTVRPPRFPGALPRVTSPDDGRYLRIRPGTGQGVLLEAVDLDARRSTITSSSPDPSGRAS